MSKNYGKGTQYPTVNLAINKSRIKLYGSVTMNPAYYLNQGEEFQIELFNPTTHVILAKISLNGNLISSGGLVIKPGQRIFLDRFLDDNKKFLFDTYQVDNIQAVKQAIKDNGDLEVSFFKELILTVQPTFNFTRDVNSYYNSSTSIGSNLNTTFTTNSTNLLSTNSLETGRIEKGSESKQKFETVNMEFETAPFHDVSFKLLPYSEKKVTIDEVINKYCSNCGKKNKINNKFCPNCGTKR